MTEELLAKEVERRANHIRSILADRGMSQVELAKLLDTNPQSLNRAIQGDMTPRSLKLRKQINKVLGI